jgi:hypothetical protein
MSAGHGDETAAMGAKQHLCSRSWGDLRMNTASRGQAIRSCLWGIAGMMLVTVLTACGGGSGRASTAVAAVTPAPPVPPTAYTVSVTVSGLSGSGLILQLNTANDLAIAANGNFTFANSLADGTSYAITVKTQPASPAQVCSVVNGAGVVSSQAVTGIIINCTNPNCPTVVSNSSGGSPAPSTPTAFVLGSTVVYDCIIGYPANSSGPVSPTVSITLPALAASDASYVSLTADSSGYVYVLSISGPPQDMAGEVLVFAPGANGMATPVRTLVVPGPFANFSDAIAVDGTGAIYVSNVNNILVFAPGADGNAPPIRTIGASAQAGEFGCGQLAVDASGNIVCAFNELGVIQVFSNALTGNGTLARTISIPDTAPSGHEIVGLSLDPAGNIYVAAKGELMPGFPVSILEFAGGTTGTAAPVTILTPDTLPGNCNVNSLGFDAAGNLYVYELEPENKTLGYVPAATPTVLRFTAAANGFASPTTESLASFTNYSLVNASFAID